MLSNYQISDIATDLNIKLAFKNIVMRNEFNSGKICNYVINLQSSYQGNGSHWCCLVVEKDFGFYFDSFGATPPIEVIQICKKTIKYCI
jgi:hypothetical protein